MRWPQVALKQVANVVSGATPKSKVAEYWGQDVRWATPTDLSKNDGPYLNETARRITYAGLKSCATQILPPGSVLMSSRAPIGLVAINTEPMATNQGFKSLVPDRSRIFEGYLYHWLAANTAQLQSLGNGATFKEVSKAVVERIEIPLPPLEEQRRIAGILDAADALRRRRREALALLDTIPGAIFAEMFGEPSTNSKALPVALLGDIVSFLDSMRRPVKKSARKSGPFPYYGANGQQGTIDGFIFDGPLILLAEDGGHFDEPEKGVAYRIDGKSWVNNHAHVLRAGPDITTEYLEWSLRHYPVGRYITGTTRGKLTKAAASRIEIPVPPRSQQEVFSDALEPYQQIRAVQTKHLDELEALFASLQSRAFAGEL